MAEPPAAKSALVTRLAWRSLWRNPRRTLITVASIGLGLAVAVVFIAVCEGVYHQVIQDGVRMQAGHLTLEHPGYREAPAVDLWIDGVAGLRRHLEQMEGVAFTKPLILAQGVARTGAGSVGVMVMGVAPGVEQEVSPLARNLRAEST